MRIFLDAEIHCADGPCGRLTHVILDPRREKIVYVVIQHNAIASLQWLVPLGPIVVGTPNKILLRCVKELISSFTPWDGEMLTPARHHELDLISRWTHKRQVESQDTSVEQGAMESDMLVLDQDVEIQGSDGYIGYLAGFQVEPTTGNITHLIVHRERKVQTEIISVPAYDIQRIQRDIIYLVSYRSILDALPSIRVRPRPRHYLSN